MNIAQLAKLFNSINEDEGEEAVPLSDTDFYTDQIFSLLDNMGTPVTVERARELASEMAALA